LHLEQFLVTARVTELAVVRQTKAIECVLRVLNHHVGETFRYNGRLQIEVHRVHGEGRRVRAFGNQTQTALSVPGAVDRILRAIEDHTRTAAHVQITVELEQTAHLFQARKCTTQPFPDSQFIVLVAAKAINDGIWMERADQFHDVRNRLCDTTATTEIATDEQLHSTRTLQQSAFVECVADVFLAVHDVTVLGARRRLDLLRSAAAAVLLL